MRWIKKIEMRREGTYPRPLPARKGSKTEHPICLSIFFILIFSWIFVIPIRAEVTREQIKEVGKELACLCGDCPRRPLDECICGYAQQQHERIKKMLASGQTPQAIVDAYISEFGLEILSEPPAKGFNLTAWLMPPLVLLIGFFGVRHVLRTWSKTKSPATPSAQPARDDPYLDRLESELKERE